MSEPATTLETRLVESKPERPKWTGATFGIVAFLIGIALLGLTFKLAFDQFAVPPEHALNIPPGTPLNVPLVVQTFAGLVIRVLLLLVMAIISAIIANRGIKMYTDARSR